METRNVVLDTIKLANGLMVHFIDRSRPIAGDRSQARLVISVPIEARQEHFAAYTDPVAAVEDFVSMCPGACFEVEKVRNFIDREKLGEILGVMKEEFIRSNLGYMERAGFARGWITGRYEELCRERTIRETHERALGKAEK